MLKTGNKYVINQIQYVFLGVLTSPKVRLVFNSPEDEKVEFSPDWIALHSDEMGLSHQ